MEKSIFIKIFKEQLESDDVQLELNTKLSEIKGWDSLSTMLVVSEFNDEFENQLTIEELNKMEKIIDIYEFYNE